METVPAITPNSQASAPVVRVIELDGMTPELMLPGLTRRYASGIQTTITLFEYVAGAVAPMHSHPQEQISYVLRGRLNATVGGRRFELGPGQAVFVPPNVPHRFEALTDALEVDFFTPARLDWASGDNSYFKPEKPRASKRAHTGE